MSFFCLLMISIISLACDKETPVVSSKTQTFVKIFGGVKNQTGSDIQATPDGGYIILGTSNSFNGESSDIYLVKVDNEGNEEWSRNYGNNKDDFGNALLVNKEGDYIVLGTTTNEVDSTDLILIKINKLGEQVWERKIGERGFNEQGRMIKEDLDGNGYILVGTTSKLDYGKYPSSSLIPESDISDALIIRTDYTGNVVLSRIQGFNGPDIANDVLPIKNDLGSDEYVFVGTTTKYSDGQPTNGSVIRFFKHNKNLGSNMEVTFGGDKNETGIGLCNTSDGGIAIVGSTSSYGNGGEGVYMIKLNLNNNNEIINLREFTFGGSNDDHGISIQEVEDGNFIILGTTNSYGYGGTDIYLLKVNAMGEEVWSRTYGDEGNETASKIIAAPDGGFVIIGTLRFGNNDMLYLIKTNRDGLLFAP